jgi:hypothetical protein
MKKLLVYVVALAAMLAPSLRAQDIKGDWQGMLNGVKQRRVVVRISKGDKDDLSATLYSLDEGARPIPATSVTLDGQTIKIAVDTIRATYDGKLSADGKSMVGRWTHGEQPVLLTLVRTTPATAWEIPPPAPVKPKDAKSK